MMRLSEDMGRHQAHHLLYEAAQTAVMRGVGFAEALKANDNLSHLAVAEIDALTAPENYTGDSEPIASLYARWPNR